LEFMPREVYSHWYNWSDLNVLETLLRRCYSPDFLVVEVATGPNIALPHVLKRIASSFRYVALDMERTHIQLQRGGVGAASVHGVVGDAVHLPLRSGCVDVFVFHHAIDDILETRGFGGVKASVEGALGALKAGGCMIFSHSVFTYDPYTLEISVSDIQVFLEGKVRGRFQRVDGPRQRWLLVEDIHVHG